MNVYEVIYLRYIFQKPRFTTVHDQVVFAGEGVLHGQGRCVVISYLIL